MRHLAVAFVASLALILWAAEPVGKAAYEAFVKWRQADSNRTLDWDRALAQYRKKLESERVSEAAIERALSAINSYGEAELYDGVYDASPTFNTEPNQLLVSAVQNVTPGEALDVAMGQGRNSIFLASKGWRVTGFDVSAAGLKKARETAAQRGLSINAVHSSDEDFDFGRNRWDLIAVIYSLEKRSVQRAREALKPGGIIVVEAGHTSASGAPFEYTTGELRKLFADFRIIKYEEVTAIADWSRKSIRLVRLIAQKK